MPMLCAMESRKQQRPTVWKHSDVPCCNCPCLGYMHTHCLCERCRGRAVSRATEFRHWSAAKRESEMSTESEGQISRSVVDQQSDRDPSPPAPTNSSPLPSRLADGSGSGAIATPDIDVTPRSQDAITSGIVRSLVEALQLMEDKCLAAEFR